MTIQANEIAAVVTQHIDTELYDGLEKINPLWNHLITNGKKKVSGGTYLQFPIKLLKNKSQAFISGTGAIIDTTPSQQLQYGVLNWKYNYFSVNFTLADFTQAANAKEAIRDFIADKKDLAKADYYRDLSESVYASSASNSLKFEGLADIVAASGTAYGGLTDTDYTDATKGNYLPYISTDTTLNYISISDLITQSRSRTQKMGLNGKMFGLMNPYLFNKMMGELQGSQMFLNGNEIVKAGFQSFNINGVDFYMDVDCPGTGDGSTSDNYVYLIPEDVLKLTYKYGVDDTSPFDGSIRLPNQPIVSVQKYMAANMVCNNRRVISVCKTYK